MRFANRRTLELDPSAVRTALAVRTDLFTFFDHPKKSNLFSLAMSIKCEFY